MGIHIIFTPPSKVIHNWKINRKKGLIFFFCIRYNSFCVQVVELKNVQFV